MYIFIWISYKNLFIELLAILKIKHSHKIILTTYNSFGSLGPEQENFLSFSKAVFEVHALYKDSPGKFFDHIGSFGNGELEQETLQSMSKAEN